MMRSLFRDSKLAEMAALAEKLGATMQMQDPPPGLPPQPPTQQYPAPQPPTQQYPAPPPAPQPYPPQDRTFTAAELEAARQQEKQKLYEKIAEADALKAKFAEFEQQQAAAQAAAEEAQRKAEEEARAKALEEADAKGAVAIMEREFQQKMAAMQQETELRLAVMEKEREFERLEAYRKEVLLRNQEEILPRLRKLEMVRGNTVEEIDQSIILLVEATAQTNADILAAQTGGVRTAPGVSPNAPMMGPEMYSPQTTNITAEQLAAMSMEEYAQYRSQFPTGRAGGTGRGLLS